MTVVRASDVNSMKRYRRSRRVWLALVAVFVCLALTISLNSIGIISFENIRTGGDTVHITPRRGTNIMVNSNRREVPAAEKTNTSGNIFDCGVQNMTAKADLRLENAPGYDDGNSTVLKNCAASEETQMAFDEYEDGISWTQLETLDIFSNPEYNGEHIIAPGTTGSYFFKLKNLANFSMNCNFHFEDIDDSEYRVPMLYRMHTEDGYIFGSENTWLTLQDIIDRNIIFQISGAKDYVLDWLWEYEDPENLAERDALDTAIGNRAARFGLDGQPLLYKIQLVLNAVQTGPSPKTGEMPVYAAPVAIAAFLSAIIIFFIVSERRKREKAKKENELNE